MIGVQTIRTLLPPWATVLFVIMLLSGLSSTLDSGLCATSSLWITDVCGEIRDDEAISQARKVMATLTLSGLTVALASAYLPGFGLKHLWWIFNTIAASLLVPTVLSLYWRGLQERGVLMSCAFTFLIGVPSQSTAT